jgi:hypothetical protein
MKLRLACVALCFGLGSPISLWPAQAQACSCVGAPSPQEAADAATAVFEGKVLGMTEDKPEGSYFPYHVYEFEVARHWKGQELERQKVRTMSNSAACGRSFTVGETYLVYARESEGQLSDNLCSRTRPIAEADEDIAFLGGAGNEPEPPPAPAEPEPPRIDDAAPPAPEPSPRGCSVGDPVSLWPLLLLAPAWRRSRRRERG